MDDAFIKAQLDSCLAHLLRVDAAGLASALAGTGLFASGVKAQARTERLGLAVATQQCSIASVKRTFLWLGPAAELPWSPKDQLDGRRGKPPGATIWSRSFATAPPEAPPEEPPAEAPPPPGASKARTRRDRSVPPPPPYEWDSRLVEGQTCLEPWVPPPSAAVSTLLTAVAELNSPERRSFHAHARLKPATPPRFKVEEEQLPPHNYRCARCLRTHPQNDPRGLRATFCEPMSRALTAEGFWQYEDILAGDYDQPLWNGEACCTCPCECADVEYDPTEFAAYVRQTTESLTDYCQFDQEMIDEGVRCDNCLVHAGSWEWVWERSQGKRTWVYYKECVSLSGVKRSRD